MGETVDFGPFGGMAFVWTDKGFGRGCVSLNAFIRLGWIGGSLSTACVVGTELKLCRSNDEMLGWRCGPPRGAAGESGILEAFGEDILDSLSRLPCGAFGAVKLRR